MISRESDSVRFSFQVQHAAYMQNVRAVRVLNFLTDENLELICELTAQF